MLRLAALMLWIALPAQAETALAAVAANFADTAKTLAAQFRTNTGHEVEITTGATGKLFAQITQGAPFDLLLSADAETPARLAADGHGAPFTYALGKLTLWIPSAAAKTSAEVALEGPATRHIAIANPDLAPYGKASLAAIDAMGLSPAIRDKIVMGQNIGQAFALVQSGAAEAGFIAHSALPPDAKGLIWEVTPSLYPAIRQDAILLKHGAENPAALGFLAYLSSPEARATIAQNGYALP
jgi:molybdate transport system substrate-binding protein